MSLSDLPLASGQKHRRVLERAFGFECRRNGEHVVMVSALGTAISIPNHAEVKRPTLKQVLRVCGIEDKEYRRAFDLI